MFTNHKIAFEGINNIRNLKIDNDKGINTEVKVLFINLDPKLDHGLLLKVEDITSLMKEILNNNESGIKVVHRYENTLRDSESPMANKFYVNGLIEECGVIFNLPLKLKTIYFTFVTEFDAHTILGFHKDKSWFGEHFGKRVPTKTKDCENEYMKMARKLIPKHFYKNK